MDSKKRTLFAMYKLFLCLFLWGFLQAGFTAEPPKSPPVHDYVMGLYQRILAIGQSLLEFEEELLFRIGKKRLIDFNRAAARFLSGTRQFTSLLRLARHLEQRIPSTHPSLAKIQSLRGKIGFLLAAHRKNRDKLQQTAAWADLKSSLENLEKVLENPPAGTLGSTTFPIGTVDKLF